MPPNALELRIRPIDLDVGRYQVVLHREDASSLGLHAHDRVEVQSEDRKLVAVLDVTESIVDPGEVGVFPEVGQKLGLEGVEEHVFVQPAERPESVQFIKKKMYGQTLTTPETRRLVEDMVSGALTEIELSSYVTSVNIHGMELQETVDLTQAMVETGEVIEFGDQVIFDKHSIGGVPGNKITLLIVPIVAAAGLKIPKTSSRAITGAAGTSDVVELFCNVHLGSDDIRRITNEIGGVMAWGGAVNLAPADDIIINVEHPLAIDPEPLLLASVMAKKAAVSAQNLVIDIPMGEGSKVPTMEEAKTLARDFIDLGERLGMRVECAITYGGQPVGKTVGPALEANEALDALRGDGAPESFVKKSTAIAGILLEMGGLARRDQGQEMARQLLDSGEAFETFCQIVQAQGGDEPDTLPVGDHTWDLVADRDGYISRVDNRALVNLARALGAPKVKGAGVTLTRKRGDKVDEGQTLVTLHAESEYQLDHARKLAQRFRPLEVEGMLLERVPAYREVGSHVFTAEQPPAIEDGSG